MASSKMSKIELSKLLTRIGYLDLINASTLTDRSASIPEEARTYLVSDNPRLIELKERYSRIHGDVVQHSQWTDRYVSEEVLLNLFRKDSGYVWQYRDLNFPSNYLCTYYFLKCSSDCDLLDLCQEDDLFGPYTLSVNGECVTRDRLDSVCELGFLRHIFGLNPASNLYLLDIGGGYGRFAYRMAQCFPSVKVLCADAIPESSFICEFYLKYRKVKSARVVEMPVLTDQIRFTRIHLAVAINSLSECSSQAVKWWLKLLRDNEIRHLLFIPHAGHNGGREAFIRDAVSYTYHSIDELCSHYGFHNVISAPKYSDVQIQQFGVSPTYYHLYSSESY